ETPPAHAPAVSSFPVVGTGESGVDSARCGHLTVDRCGAIAILDLVVAHGAVDRIAVAGHEWDSGCLATLRADHFGHRAVRQSKLRLARRPALRAARRDVDKLLFLVELLFASGPGEWLVAFPAPERLVLEVHVFDPP